MLGMAFGFSIVPQPVLDCIACFSACICALTFSWLFSQGPRHFFCVISQKMSGIEMQPRQQNFCNKAHPAHLPIINSISERALGSRTLDLNQLLPARKVFSTVCTLRPSYFHKTVLSCVLSVTKKIAAIHSTYIFEKTI